MASRRSSLRRGRDLRQAKGRVIDHEIARVLQNIGIGKALEAHVARFTASEYFGVDGQLIKRLDMLPPPFPMGWTPSMVFMQPALEALLRGGR